jgi:ubiquinone/menaquinone biosynthesis C-methylase UbiE
LQNKAFLMNLYIFSESTQLRLLVKSIFKKADKPNPNNLDAIEYKIGSILDWSTRADYYHVNWVKENVGPFKATVKLVDALKIEPNDFVLDIACGTGAASREISYHLTGAGALVGIDLSRTALSIANSWVSSSFPSNNNKCFIEMDAENIGLKSSIFNKVTCQFALSFFPDPARAMREVRNVMKSHSNIGVVVHGPEERVPYLSTISGPSSKYMPDKISRGLLSVHRFGRPEDLRRLMIDAGFSNVSISTFTFDYEAGSFEDYWSGYFLNGYGNALSRVVLTKKNESIITRIRSEAKEIASRYVKNGTIQFPWEVHIATACS